MKLSDLDGGRPAGVAGNETNAFFISLSDVMILLCVFFIMLVSVSKVDTVDFERVRSAMSGTTENTLQELSVKLDTIVTEEPGIPGVSVHMTDEGVRVDLDTAALFDSGSAVLKEGSLDSLQPVLDLVLRTKYKLDIEGHTDDVPLFRRKGEEVDTNWSLSGRRASSVLQRLLDAEFTPDRLRIVGYADTKPKMPIDGLEGEALDHARAENRRVSIMIR